MDVAAAKRPVTENARYAVTLTAALGLAATLLITSAGFAPAYQNRALHVAKETAGALVLLLVAALMAAIFASFSNGIAILTGQRETLIGAVSALLLPLTFLSGALMQLSLAPGWIGTVAKFNPVDWAASAARNATMQSFDWGLVGLRLGLLAALTALAAFFATRAFSVYQRSL
jgi:ABC-2 type transport system permease protein